MNQKLTPIFQGNTITLPYAHPVVLKGTKEDKNFAFIFSHNDESFYIFVTLEQGVINNNLPGYLDQTSKDLLIDAVNQYCELSRQGFADNIFKSNHKKNISDQPTEGNAPTH